MKVKIGNYKTYFGPYQLAKLLCFWVKKVPTEYGAKEYPEWVDKFGEWLAHGSIEPEQEIGEIRKVNRPHKKTWLHNFLMWVDAKKSRTIKVRIDDWDTWSMDHTLAYVILPMLKQLKEKATSAPWVDDADVPEELKSTSAPPKENEYDVDDNHFKRWDWVLEEMIFAFESKVDDNWEDQFYSGGDEFGFKKLENGMFEMVGNNTTIDAEGRKAYQDRITNGFRLFGKYYEGLWI